MPRSNYGNAVKQRAVNFFTVLIDYANDELDLDDRRLDLLQRDIQFNWQTEKRCAIRTKVRHLEDLCDVAGVKLTGEQIKESIKCLSDFLGIIEDNRTSKGGSETWHFTMNLWHDRIDRAGNIHKFEAVWDEKKSDQSRVVVAETESEPDIWTEIVRSSLVVQHYQRLTTNPLMDGDRFKFSLDDVYIPLGLMPAAAMDIVEEREFYGNSGADLPASMIPNLDQLLERLFANPELNRLAIVGEPGAGKTTCLQKLAAGLLDAQYLPIWVSLADLQGVSLEQYLLNDWLKMATRQAIVDTKLQQDFAAQFSRGKVWLLLDAVDEMAIDPSIALASLERQFRGWLGGAQIVLTCRSNVWSSGKNALENFTTYRHLGLNYRDDRATSNRTHDFIYGWFKHAPDVGESLIAELSQPQYQRLRDAIKNPLRLALLCGYHSRAQGKLPSTKAILYQQFTDTIYEWKQDRFPTNLAQRQQLDRALSKLALAAIAGDGAPVDRWRFRLHHHTVSSIVEPELLELALQLGWLDRVGISARTGEKTYAFYHSTFQEYFAARSIDSWQYFFQENDGNLLPIFSPNWQETILFWFGRIDVPASEKEACIEALINFDRQCGVFYYYRAYFLAAAALAEFPESRHSSTIIDRLLTWRFASHNPTENTWEFYPLPIQDGARIALRQTDLTAAIAGLERFIKTSQNPFLCWQAAHSLGKVYDPGNQVAIQALIAAIPRVTGGDLKIKICESLIKIDPQFSQLAVDTLVEIVDTVKWTAIVRKAAFTLGKLAIDPALNIENRDRLIQMAIDTLVAIVDNSNNLDLQLAAIENLRLIDPTHTTTERQFTAKQTPPTSTRHRRKKVPDRREIDVAIAEIERKLANTDKAELQRRYAYQLGKFQPGHLLAFETLLNLITSAQPSSFYKRTGEYLQEIITDDRLPLAIDRLKSCVAAVESGDRSSAVLEQYKLLWYCAERLPYRQFIQIWND